MRSAIIIFFVFMANYPLSAQTQYDLNSAAAESYHKADQELNTVYKQIIREYAGDSVFVSALKASQRVWVNFRDAELKMKFPPREEGFYGSMHSMCVSSYLEQLTTERVLTLRQWLDGVDDEGDCTSSVRAKE